MTRKPTRPMPHDHGWTTRNDGWTMRNEGAWAGLGFIVIMLLLLWSCSWQPTLTHTPRPRTKQVVEEVISGDSGKKTTTTTTTHGLKV